MKNKESIIRHTSLQLIYLHSLCNVEETDVLTFVSRIDQLLNLSNYKLIFIMLPGFIRKFIPLKYWPGEYPYDALILNVVYHHISEMCESLSVT